MQKRLSYIAAVYALVCSCQTNSATQALEHFNKRDTLPRQLVIKDRDSYSAAFIDSLRKAHYPGSMKLENNYIVVGKDTTRFPEDLKPDSTYRFSADKGSNHYSLTLQRINQTDVLYSFEVTARKTDMFHHNGQAVLSPLFFLTPDVAQDEASGEEFEAYPYLQNTKGQPFIIEIENHKQEHQPLRAMIKSNDKNNTAVANTPVLRTK